MIGANWKFTDDHGRKYHAVWNSQVNGPVYWVVTRDDGEHVTVPFTDDAGIEIERREVERRALEEFEQRHGESGSRR